MNVKRVCLLLALLAVSVSFVSSPNMAFGQDQATMSAAPEPLVTETPPDTDVPWWLWAVWSVAPIAACAGLYFAWRFYHEMLRSDEGDEDMIRISGYVRDGAMAYLWRQYTVVVIFFIVVSALLFYMGWVLHAQHQIVL